MPSIIGNTGTSIYTIPYNEGCTLESFSLISKTGGTVTASLAIRDNEIDYMIIPENTLVYSNIGYISDVQRQINAGQNFHLVVDGSTDYQFSTGKPK